MSRNTGGRGEEIPDFQPAGPSDPTWVRVRATSGLFCFWGFVLGYLFFYFHIFWRGWCGSWEGWSAGSGLCFPTQDAAQELLQQLVCIFSTSCPAESHGDLPARLHTLCLEELLPPRATVARNHGSSLQPAAGFVTWCVSGQLQGSLLVLILLRILILWEQLELPEVAISEAVIQLLPENFISCLCKGDKDAKDCSVTREGIRSIRCYELQERGRNPTGIKSTQNVKKEIFLEKVRY